MTTDKTPLNADDELKTKASDSSSEAGYPIIPELYEYCLGAGLELSNYQAVELTKLILADRKKHELQARIDENMRMRAALTGDGVHSNDLMDFTYDRIAELKAERNKLNKSNGDVR